MSNFLRKNHDAAGETTSRTRGRKLWLASGVAGLTGVVSLAGVGFATSAGAAGMDRLTDLKWSTAEQVAKDDGGYGRDEREGRKERDERDERGGQRPGEDGKAEDGKGEDWGRVQEVPCNPDRLIAAITRANADNGGTLKLARGCTYTLTVNNGPGGSGLPPISQNITIKGEDSTLVRAANAAPFRFFDVVSGGHLRLSDLTLTGGNGLTGGAILVERGGTAEIAKSRLVNNDALAAGGAIENEGTTVLDHSVLTNNTAILAGGAINNTGLLKVSDSKIAGNAAGAAGGAINNFTGTVVVHKTAITGNRSVGAGGGIASEGGIVNLDDTEVTDNTTGVTGGGIGVLNSQLTLRHSTVARNASVGGGGGIANTSGLLLSSTVTIEDSKIAENLTDGIGGGGILNVDLTPAGPGGTASLTVRNSEIVKNKATLGGGIRNINGTVALTNAKIVNNTALAPNGGGGINTNTNITAVDPTTVIVGNRPNNCTGTVTNCFG
ncbi:hypothetical protein [Micromonospora carbonacea]|uniref:Right-handed parallel beta-helix repeat-containing protein n=1 Tax=Micromonospora carbonacea TaxID=47853 RepID=A0A7H8XPS5_9ACTN|nr:hypothetical protein [Micromonospora carbonacea]MBB5825456.1 hypothetical protein [Micromonospora carbonacea]QLD26498.1 hypothetical protein HXZ27_21655 [Micromonospora carbonacea]